MKMSVRLSLFVFLTVFLIGSAPSYGISLPAPPLPPPPGEFIDAISSFFRLPDPGDVLDIRKRGVPDDELPVVFFLAGKFGVPPLSILDLRLGGRSWLDITIRFGYGPEIFYVPVKAKKIGPPYGKAYGYYKKKPRTEWKTIQLQDVDIINLVNLRFISDHYGIEPDEVMSLREGGKSFVNINSEVKNKKGKGTSGSSKDKKSGSSAESSSTGGDKGKGKGTGKGKKK